ncbi:hypothetical protein EON62_01550, partial [archaeon]
VLYCGGSGVYMSPLTFVKHPILWPRTMSKYGATHVQSPNFGYKLAARKWRESGTKEILNLSTVRHMFNAAEPITVSAITDFLTTFAAHGLAPASMSPGFGLAEHTVYVSDAGESVVQVDHVALALRSVHVLRTLPIVDVLEDVRAAPASAVAKYDTGAYIVSCGRVAPACDRNPDIHVMIVDADSRRPCAAQQVGEIWISSASVANGYWGRPEVTDDVFHARIADAAPVSSSTDVVSSHKTADSDVKEHAAGDHDAKLEEGREAKEGDVAGIGAAAHDAISRTYLRTGDLGFIHAGELYVCGRAKDLIIAYGKNYYPQDIEHTAEKLEQLRPGCSAAFQCAVPRPSPAAAAGASAAVSFDTDVVLVAELRDASWSDTQLRDLAMEVRSTVLREQGVALTAVLLLRSHAARKVSSSQREHAPVQRSLSCGCSARGGPRSHACAARSVQTTSGKISRHWNKVAFQQFTGADAATVNASPWHTSPPSVLHFWIASPGASAVQTAEEAAVAGGYEEEGADQAASSPATLTAAVAAGVAEGVPVHGEGEYSQLVGDALRAQLKRDVGAAMQLSAASIPSHLSLMEMGMDSLAISQFSGLLKHAYGFQHEDAALFQDGCTLDWLVASAAQLRVRQPPGAAPIMPPPPPSAPTGAGGGDVTAQPGSELHAVAVAGPDGGVGSRNVPAVEEVALRPPRRTQPTWFQRNFPCCVCCW